MLLRRRRFYTSSVDLRDVRRVVHFDASNSTLYGVGVGTVRLMPILREVRTNPTGITGDFL